VRQPAAPVRLAASHARIRRIDTPRATALPGMRAVLTSADAPEITWYQDSWLFDRTVRYIGDEVAAVAADAEEIAEDALRLIEVDYEPLAFVVDLEAALRADAPKVREQVAEKLKLPEHRVRVIKQHMGGGFGSKRIAWKHAVIAALLSKQAGRPVQRSSTARRWEDLRGR
jgi:CO/xanthine dehydrogenase Mo-binding subunit